MTAPAPIAQSTAGLLREMRKDRPPVLRLTKGDPEDLAMNLPEGKTCGDCCHSYQCSRMLANNPTDEVCDWSPSRFYAKSDA